MPKRKNNTTGYFGVIQRSNGRYRARIQIKGKYKSLKTHGTASAAAKAYDDEAIKLRRPLSKLNYPQNAPIGYTPIQQSLYASNSVGYRGVSKNRKNFQAQIKIDATLTYIGTYTTSKDAAIAYDRAVIKLNLSSTLLNFPDMIHDLNVEPIRKRRKVSSTGFKGVVKRANGNFATVIKINGKTKTIGPFRTPIAAALAYDIAVIEKINSGGPPPYNTLVPTNPPQVVQLVNNPYMY